MFLVLAALVVFTSDARRPPFEEIMTEMDATVVLPPGASPLSSYGRNYAWRTDGRDGVIQGNYLLVNTLYPPNFPCSAGRDKDDSILGCTPEYRRHIVNGQAAAGRHMWFNEFARMPFIADGRCLQVNVLYSTIRHSVISVRCNGVG